MPSSDSKRPLPALLSQVLVAFTVEFDNEFERRMAEAGYQGARLSLVVWENLIRFLAQGEQSVRDLTAQAFAPPTRMKFELGCLERWGFVVLHTGGRRDGWGSGRGIRADWQVRLTSSGLAASAIWPPLFAEIESRWETRFGGTEIGRLRQCLHAIADHLDLELPRGLPGRWQTAEEFPPRADHSPEDLPLPALLSQVLLAFRLEFESESPAPLTDCANTLRVLGTAPTRLSDIPALTGLSPETSDIGWQLKPYVVVTSDPSASRGKVVSLSPRGLQAQRTYHRLVREIEERWESRFTAHAVASLRESLQSLFEQQGGGRPVISEGLVPPPGTVRAGSQVPALGRKDVGVAARRRGRDMVVQTEGFVRDPAGSLPHYPAWDMNRGFGP